LPNESRHSPDVHSLFSWQSWKLPWPVHAVWQVAFTSTPKPPPSFCVIVPQQMPPVQFAALVHDNAEPLVHVPFETHCAPVFDRQQSWVVESHVGP